MKIPTCCKKNTYAQLDMVKHVHFKFETKFAAYSMDKGASSLSLRNEVRAQNGVTAAGWSFFLNLKTLNFYFKFSPNRPTGPIWSSSHDVQPFVVCCQTPGSPESGWLYICLVVVWSPGRLDFPDKKKHVSVQIRPY